MRHSRNTRYLQCIWACSLLYLSFNVVPVASDKVLIAPYLFTSHVHQFLSIGTALKDAGHDVYVMLGKSYPNLQKVKSGPLKVLEYRTVDPDFHTFSEDESDNLLESLMSMTVVDDFRYNVHGFLELCTNPLKDAEFSAEVKEHNFDLAVVDIFPGSVCFLALMYRLDIPYVGFSLQQPWAARNPALPSFVPFSLSKPGYTEKMNFWERLNNIVELLDWYAFPRVKYMDDAMVAEFVPNKPPVTFNYLAGRSQIFFIDNDVLLDYPQPLMPNEIHVGGMATKPAKQLPTDLEAFVNSSTHGVILLSFGSFSANLPAAVVDKFMNTFRRVKQRVIWRFPHSPPEDIPSNVKLLDWLPQNDILGHPKMRVFITHCGAGGQFEAVYHGVPMIGFPMFAEQPYNAKRMVYHGYGIQMNILDFTEEELVENINKIMSDKSYSSKIRKAATIFRTRPMRPTERLVFWVNHVLKFGGDHLHSYALDMPWYEYIMLDIAVFFILVLVTVISLFCCTCKFILRKMCSKTPPTKLKTN